MLGIKCVSTCESLCSPNVAMILCLHVMLLLSLIIPDWSPPILGSGVVTAWWESNHTFTERYTYCGHVDFGSNKEATHIVRGSSRGQKSNRPTHFESKVITLQFRNATKEMQALEGSRSLRVRKFKRTEIVPTKVTVRVTSNNPCPEVHRGWFMQASPLRNLRKSNVDQSLKIRSPWATVEGLTRWET